MAATGLFPSAVPGKKTGDILLRGQPVESRLPADWADTCGFLFQDAAQTLASRRARQADLDVSFRVQDHFAASINHGDAYEVAVKAMESLGIPHGSDGLPMRASEDFGVFGQGIRAAMLCVGPGETYPALHNPDYDFPDDLIPIGSAIFERIARDLLDQDLST
jgi:metal-dependent amidase/aminoacylase/carboxypeptidase family protein